jgi:RimJ/RimL family protein N-acetyltransferase
MHHKINVEGHVYRLRPIGDRDAEFIISLRTDPDLNHFLHTTPTNCYSQLEWLSRYYKRPGDWYFVIERRCDSASEGLISLYDFDAEKRKAEWGRWILRKGSIAAVESAWLIYRCAFEQLCLREVYCRTVAENKAVVSFHDSCGITERETLPDHFNLNDRKLDAVEHRVTDAEWKMLSPRLEHLARRMARRMQCDS